jgi:hypothetical protein
MVEGYDVVRVQFGTRPDGSVVHISELGPADRGLRCGCTCAKCGDRLAARLGAIRVHHFAHTPGRSCAGNRESALHALAKEIFSRHTRIMVPEATIDAHGGIIIAAKAQYLAYTEARQEVTIGGVRADITLARPDLSKKALLVEIAVTHFVDEEKAQRLEELGYPCVEIDLSNVGLEFQPFDRGALESLLIDDTDGKTWITIPGREHYVEQLRVEADRRRADFEARAEAERLEAERRVRMSKSRVERVLSPAYQREATARRRAGYAKHPRWIRNRRSLGLPDDVELPYYLNHPVAEEFLFTCHRTVWQSTVFLSWVYRKQLSDRNPDIPLWYVADNFLKHNADLVERDLLYAKKDVYCGPRLGEVFSDYFDFLETCGFVEKEWEGRKGAAVYMCVRPGLIVLPQEYNNERYLPRPEGVLDRESGEVIRLAGDGTDHGR